MSQRKKRSRSAEATSGVKQPAAGGDAASKPAPPAAHPPQRNVAMLTISSLLFLVWILFLAYVALFG